MRHTPFAVVTIVALAAIACRPPFPPIHPTLGSSQVRFEETKTTIVTVKDCPSAEFTVAVRESIHSANPPDGFKIVLHRGPTQYLGNGWAYVHCGDVGSINRLAEEYRREIG